MSMIKKNKMEKGLLILAGIIVVLCILPMITAELGCCFEKNSGLCTQRTDRNLCTAPDGEFSTSPDCSADSRCQRGCCVTGINTKYETERTCQIISRDLGIEMDFQPITEEECYAIALGIDTGACVFDDGYDKTCTFTTREICENDEGEFKKNVLCSAVVAGYSRTEKTTCYPQIDGSVHYVDNHENPDELKEKCDYTQGKICRQTSETTAICKDFNCDNGKKHGESWCVNEEFDLVGARDLRQYCLNNEIITEPCEDYKGQVCVGGKCIENPWYICMDAGTDKEACDEKYCMMYDGTRGAGTANPNLFMYKIGSVDGHLITRWPAQIGEEYGLSKGDGSKTIITDGTTTAELGFDKISAEDANKVTYRIQNAGDYNFDYASGNVKAQLVLADGSVVESVALPKVGWSEEWDNIESSSSGQEISEYNNLKKELMENPEKGMASICVPKIPGGFPFWPESFGSDSGSSIEVYDTSKEYCGTASVEPIKMTFAFHANDQGQNWMVPEETSNPNDFGYAGIFDMNGDNWYKQTSYTIGCKENNQLYKMGWEDENCKAIIGDLDKKYTSADDTCNFANCVLFGKGKYPGMPLASWVVPYLKGRCQSLGDCDGKSNWIEVRGSGNSLGKIGEADIGGGSSTQFSGSTTRRGDGTNCEQYNDGLTSNAQESGILKNCRNKEGSCLCDVYTASSKSSSSGSAGGGNYYYIPCKSIGGQKIACTLEYSCKPFKAPKGNSNCRKCGEDKVPCTEYRCKSLGQGCEYYEPAGADKGYCEKAEDYNMPRILSHTVNPQSPIPPYSSVNLTLETDETTFCKFEVGGGSTAYEDMKYDFGETWSRKHQAVLNIPGRRSLENENISEYDLINDEGIYDVYVKCEDLAGNPTLKGYLIRFEVDKKPDTTAPLMSDFNPPTNGYIKHGLTAKKISFKLNEPAECKWSKQDDSFAAMSNSFVCDTVASDTGVINGYKCEGTLTEISNITGSESKYYIKCKDQPYLEGQETDIYKRNANSKSMVYVLRASPELKIISTSPRTDVKKGKADQTALIEAITSGGGQNGRAICRFGLSGYNNFMEKFNNTNSTMHNHRTENLSAGAYDLKITCEDESENIVNASAKFNFAIDSETPRITRAYYSQDENALRVITNEDSQCKFSTSISEKCNFGWDSASAKLMSGAGKIHTTEWVENTDYYIKCADFFGNLVSGCTIMAKTTR